MGWIGLNDCISPSPGDSCIETHPALLDFPATGPDLLTRGALQLEISLAPGESGPCRLLDYSEVHGWERRFTIYLNPDHSISVESVQGSGRSYVRLRGEPGEGTSDLRITYGWDAPARIGLLTVHDLQGGTIRQARFHAPMPLPLRDLHRIICGHPQVRYDGRISHVALADRVVPVGPSPTIAAGAMVLTASGPRPIERIGLNDEILTLDGKAQPVRWLLKQEIPARGHASVLRLRAPYFGLKADLTLTRSQKLVVSSAAAEYDIGQRSTLISVRDLLHHPGVMRPPTAPTITCYQILLDSHACINVNGAWLDSLFIGRLAQAPAIAASTGLGRMPIQMMPIHARRALPELRHYEARALFGILSA